MGNCMAAPQVVDGALSDTAHVGGGASIKTVPKHVSGLGGAALSHQQVAPDAQPAAAPPGPPKPDAMKIHQMKKRIAVVAEAISSAADIEVPVMPKTDYAERLIGAALHAYVLGRCVVHLPRCRFTLLPCGGIQAAHCGKSSNMQQVSILHPDWLLCSQGH